jgi:hypothetical protein
MPRITLAVLAALATTIIVTTKAENPLTCLTSVDANVDYFPDKVKPTDAKLFDIEYGLTFKIVSNLAVNETYLLYQCGSEPPEEQLDGRHAHVLKIPLSGVAVTQTPVITYLEQLGLVEEIAVFLTSPDLISSPCFKARVDADEVFILADVSDTDFTGGTGSAQASDAVAFVSPFDQNLPFEKQIVISAVSEGPSEAIFEWVKFYSAFFNKEAMANVVVETANSRYDCIAGNAALIRTDSPDKPVVLWAYYLDFTGCQGWDVAKCPDRYYCDYADACAAEIISTELGSIECFGSAYMTTEEFVELGKDADYWIYPGSNWDETLANNTELLSQMKSVQNQEVYDILGLGQNAWFEQRLAEYYDVLDDFCTIVGTTTIFNRERSFLRNVFTEEANSVEEQCIDPTASLILNDKHDCVPSVLTAPPVDGATPPADASGATTISVLVGVFTLAVATHFF